MCAQTSQKSAGPVFRNRTLIIKYPIVVLQPALGLNRDRCGAKTRKWPKPPLLQNNDRGINAVSALLGCCWTLNSPYGHISQQQAIQCLSDCDPGCFSVSLCNPAGIPDKASQTHSGRWPPFIHAWCPIVMWANWTHTCDIGIYKIYLTWHLPKTPQGVTVIT